MLPSIVVDVDAVLDLMNGQVSIEEELNTDFKDLQPSAAGHVQKRAAMPIRCQPEGNAAEQTPGLEAAALELHWALVSLAGAQRRAWGTSATSADMSAGRSPPVPASNGRAEAGAEAGAATHDGGISSEEIQDAVVSPEPAAAEPPVDKKPYVFPTQPDEAVTGGTQAVSAATATGASPLSNGDAALVSGGVSFNSGAALQPPQPPISGGAAESDGVFWSGAEQGTQGQDGGASRKEGLDGEGAPAVEEEAENDRRESKDTEVAAAASETFGFAYAMLGEGATSPVQLQAVAFLSLGATAAHEQRCICLLCTASSAALAVMSPEL